MRAHTALAVVLTAACTSGAPSAPTPAPTAQPGVLTVTALLDLSGARASIGAQQRNALQMWTDQHGRSGGVPVKLETVDVAGSDAKLLIELKRAATEQLADAVVVGAPVAYDDTFGRAVDLAALPVLLLQPIGADPAGRPGGRWSFALAPSIPRLAALHLDDAARRDVLIPSVVLTDGRDRIDPMASALSAEAERRGIGGLTRIGLGSDGALPPVVRASLPVLRSVHCLAPVAACSALAREARTTASPAMVYLPFTTSASDQLRDDRDLAARAIWPSTRSVVAAPFVRDYGARFNARPDVHAAIAHDAMSLLASAAQHAGPDDRAALRDAMERITIALIATTYSFGADRRAGADPADVAYVRWDGAGAALAPTFGSVAPTASPSPSPRTPTPTPLRTATPSPAATR